MADDDIPNASVFEPEEEAPHNATATPDPEAVKAYLAEKKRQEEQQAAEGANTLLDDTQPPVAEEETPQEDNDEPMPDRITFTADPAFKTNEMDLLERQQVRVNLEDIPITEVDMRNYLKCMLLDKSLELDIELYGGKIVIHARAVSVYEQQLATAAAYDYTINQTNARLAAIIAPVFIQKLRIALQLRSFNGHLISDLTFQPEPNKLKDHIALLEQKAEEIIGSCSAPRWNAYIYALNVFEHKLTKLNEMALNRDFLNPGG